MPHPDDESALLALDAIDTDELEEADVVVRTDVPTFGRVTTALAERAARRPPDDLRDAVLRQARRRRPIDRPAHPVSACSPVEAFDRTRAEVHRLLTELSPAEWSASGDGVHDSVRAIVAHLVGAERVATHWLLSPDSTPVQTDHVILTGEAFPDAAARTPSQLIELWSTAVRRFQAAAADGDRQRPVVFYDRWSTPDAVLVARTFELWTHLGDICAATGRPAPTLDPERMAALSGALMSALPRVLRPTAAATAIKFVLTGSGGGVHRLELGVGTAAGVRGPARTATIVADVVQLCRLASRRLTLDELAPWVEGDPATADAVLNVISSFALD